MFPTKTLKLKGGKQEEKQETGFVFTIWQGLQSTVQSWGNKNNNEKQRCFKKFVPTVI